MIDADKTKLDAVFNRLSQLFEITFPVAAGWRPNIHVSHTEADTHSVAYETLQIDYMMRALVASADIQLRPEMQRGVHIKELVTDDARVVDPALPTAINAKAAEHWLARRTGDDSYFASAVAEARTNLSSAVEAIEGFTRTVAERLSRLGARTNTIEFTLLVPHEQRQYEQMYARLMDIRAQLARAMREMDASVSQADIDAQQQDIEQRVRSRLAGKAAQLPHVVHPDEAGVVLKMPTVAFGTRERVAPEPEMVPVEPVRLEPARPEPAVVRATVAEPPVEPVAADHAQPHMATPQARDIPPVYAAVPMPDDAPLAHTLVQTASTAAQPIAETVYTTPLAAAEEPYIDSPFVEEHPAIAGTHATSESESDTDADGSFSYVGGFKPVSPRAGRPVQQGSSSMFPLHFLQSALHHKQHRDDKKSAN